MTSYQGRIKQPRSGPSWATCAVFLILFVFASSFAAQLKNKEVALLTCQEFLSDLEESETFQ